MTSTTFRTLCRYAGLAASITLMSGCAMFHPKPPPPPPTPAKPKAAYSWDAEKAKTATGLAAIKVELSEQRAYFYKGNVLIGDTKCSSGKASLPTPPGNYVVNQKDLNHVSNLYGKFLDADGNVTNSNVDMSKMKVPEGNTFEGAKMPFFLRFTGGYGLHAGIVPNHPASHGCVRLPRVMAEHFYQNAVVGTPVTVEN